MPTERHKTWELVYHEKETACKTAEQCGTAIGRDPFGRVGVGGTRFGVELKRDFLLRSK
jgi:hypothetical protein